MARSIAARLSMSRVCRMALAVLPKTLSPSSTGGVLAGDLGVGDRDGAGQAGRQSQFEVRQPFTAERAAKAHDRGLAYVGSFGDFADRIVEDGTRAREHQIGHPPLGRRQSACA